MNELILFKFMTFFKIPEKKFVNQGNKLLPFLIKLRILN